MATLLMINFDAASVRRIDYDGSTSCDVSIGDGSAGVVYGLYKYVLLLRKEEKEDPSIEEKTAIPHDDDDIPEDIKAIMENREEP